MFDSVLLDMYILLQKFACNGTVIEHPEYGEVIQLQGDQRKNICQFLLEVSGCFVDTLAMALSLEWLDRPCFYTVFCGMSGYSYVTGAVCC